MDKKSLAILPVIYFKLNYGYTGRFWARLYLREIYLFLKIFRNHSTGLLTIIKILGPDFKNCAALAVNIKATLLKLGTGI